MVTSEKQQRIIIRTMLDDKDRWLDMTSNMLIDKGQWLNTIMIVDILKDTVRVKTLIFTKELTPLQKFIPLEKRLNQLNWNNNNNHQWNPLNTYQTMISR